MKLAATFFLLFFFVASTYAVKALGAPDPVDVSKPEIVRLGQVALDNINSKKGPEESKAELVEILSATVQVVSGFKTDLTLKVMENGVYKKCVVEIYEGVKKETEVKSVNCEEFTE